MDSDSDDDDEGHNLDMSDFEALHAAVQNIDFSDAILDGYRGQVHSAKQMRWLSHVYTVAQIKRLKNVIEYIIGGDVSGVDEKNETTVEELVDERIHMDDLCAHYNKLRVVCRGVPTMPLFSGWDALSHNEIENASESTPLDWAMTMV